MTDAELIARLRYAANGEHDMTPHGADILQAVDRIEQLVATNEALTKERDEQIEWVKRLADDLIAAEAKLAQAVEKFAALEKAASDVARRGAETGPQWTKLTIALLAARATLAEIKSHSDEFATQKGERHE